MAKQQITTSGAPTPGGSYSQGLKVGNLVFVAGQVPRDPQTGEIAGDTIEEQTARVLDNVKAV
ncbi:MAG TPA: Rid family hydrolase, partial [Chloroflexia bacterium]|nr:Rid family hydrolase [Chloroflexia bacterium]